MVTEQQLLQFIQQPGYKPLTFQELEQYFKITTATDFRNFVQLLHTLEEEGKLFLTSSHRYCTPESVQIFRGHLQSHSKGFGFLIPENRSQTDIYIHAKHMLNAMNGDTVLVRVKSKSQLGGRVEGEVIRVLKRAIVEVVGVFELLGTYAFVHPDDQKINRDIFVPSASFYGALDGQKVVVKIVNYPEGTAAAEGKVIEVLGYPQDPGVDILSIIRKHRLPEAFPSDVLAEAEAIDNDVCEETIIEQKRRDLRHLNIVTIDGEDAKDLDDAVHVERLANGNYKLGVHIADVGYYVAEQSKLDLEAYERGCSVYLVDRVIPMLPPRLSNGICSLHPRVNRLTVSCEMEFNSAMEIVKHDLFTSVICTKERMTYADVRSILEDNNAELMTRYAELIDDFKLMHELSQKLRHKRMQRGAVDFNFQESKIVVDKDGSPIDIVKRERSSAEQLIEEFMLAANETVAEHFHWLNVPFLYRVHDKPDPDKLEHFIAFVSKLGFTIRGRGNTIHPKALQSLLDKIEGTKEQMVISTMMLRSMKQAKYSPDMSGHFGLAASYYTHFTSPIRRYPDFVIHRIIRETIQHGGTLLPEREEYLASRMADIAQQCSERERVAVEAERDTEKMKKAQFMLRHIGQSFAGIVSSVTSFGMFVQLDNTVEGLVRLGHLMDDYYHFDEKFMILIGERTSTIFRIGDEVNIRVAHVNMEEFTIDFEIIGMKPRTKRRSTATDDYPKSSNEKPKTSKPKRSLSGRSKGVKSSLHQAMPHFKTKRATKKTNHVVLTPSGGRTFTKRRMKDGSS